ncbi:MAG: D-aminoacyl-tRNA deacylase [Clostridia bacterium]|jgi:D-tyrosyl-tRNA(Tyr) deacylase|nr:D-aminoacyl-tRNA deacylase [Clostridia bacterium]
MRAVIQRVTNASVQIGENEISRIGPGLLVLLGVGREDTEEDAGYLAEKTAHLRIFEDKAGKMNLSVKDSGGEILAVSQFTLYGDCRQGRRPGFTEAAPPEEADRLYQLYVQLLRQSGLAVKTGIFREHMRIGLENDGPVTMLLDSRKLF